MNKLLIVCGPTATGKTKIAAMLATQYEGELISADSRQIYRGMDIGTGKDKKDVEGIPIWMYDVVRPDQAYSVSQYQHDATKAIENIRLRNKLPIIVGGTGLYIQSLIQPIQTANIKPDVAFRKQAALMSVSQLQEMLQKEGKHIFENMNPSDRWNPRRLIRKIELARSKIQKQKIMKPKNEDILWVGLKAPFTRLYDRIDERVDQRVGMGIQKEILSLRQKGYDWSLPSLSGLGYREWMQYEKGELSQKEVIQQWKYHEHAYARRQMTWFKRIRDIHWVDITQDDYLEKIKSRVALWYTTEAYGIENRDLS